MSEEQKEEKPKKLFTVIHTIWDDGEIDTEMYEYRKTKSGRGAPKKWMLKGEDFKERVEEVLGDGDLLLKDMNSNVQLDSIVPTVKRISKAKSADISEKEEA